MAKVYEIKDGQKVEITTLDDIDLKNKQEEVELLIEDDLETKISLDQGERYIFGGNTQPGRWICVQGLKMWYSGVELYSQVGAIQQTEKSDGTKVTGIITGQNDETIQTDHRDITIPTEELLNALYWKYEIQYNTIASPSIWNVSPTLNFISNSEALVHIGNGFKGGMVSDASISLNTNLHILGILFNVVEIKSPLIASQTDLSDETGGVKIQMLLVVEDDEHNMYLGKYLKGNSYILLINALSQTSFDKIPFENLYEYYYAIGLKTIYEKKTLEDVKQILSPTEGDS